MRAGLEASIQAAHTDNDGYPKGSTVICANCFVPLFTLTRSICVGDKANRTVDAYRPITVQELRTLRRNVPSLQAALKTWTMDQEIAHAARIQAPKTGDEAKCPACDNSFVQVFAPEAAEVIDRAFTWRLVTIPPLSGPYPVRSSQVRFQ